MAYKRILTVQDISCVGQCSMTVAMPILSACGHETCILPTALLSTHTGGFGKPAVVHFDGALDGMWKHWLDQGITFDAILVGYLGSICAIETAGKILDYLLAPGGLAIVDPAMADHGKLYSGFDDAYLQAMKNLCQKADILLPNLTEAAMLTDGEYREDADLAYASRIVRGLSAPNVILTGVSAGAGETGILVRRGSEITHHPHRRIGKSFHGTGDIFAACFTGALLRGKTMERSVEIAGEYICRCLEETCANPAHWYGVKFETKLPELIQLLDL